MESSSNLFIVGINISADKGRKLAHEGAIDRIRYKDGAGRISVIRNVYLRAGLSRGERKKVLRDNALRIMSILHGKGSSVLLCGPTALNHSEVNGAVHLASVSAYSSKIIENGFVVHYQRLNEAFSPDLEFMRKAVRKNWIEDEFGRFCVTALPDELVLLFSCASSIRFTEDARRLRQQNKSAGPAAIDLSASRDRIEAERERRARDRTLLSINDHKRLIERLKAEKGDIESVKRAIESMGSRFTLMTRPIERAIEMVEANYRYSAFVAPNVELMARFGTIRMGEITEAGKLWRFENKAALPLMEFVRNPALAKAGEVPVFFESLLPERFKPIDGNERSSFFRMFMEGARYLNAVSIQNVHAPQPIIIDRIEEGAALSDQCDKGAVFQGRVALEVRETPERRTYKDLLTRLCETPYEPGHPFIPGMQEKAACNLDTQGVLRFAKDLPFTHIIKFPGAERFASKGANEWACMQMLSAAGVRVNAHALVDIPGAGIAYLAERFDIPNTAAGTANQVLCFEDFCSLTNIGIHKKYRTIDLVDMARIIFTESSSGHEDLDQFFRQIVGSVMVGNFDGHARNFGLISSLPDSRVAVGPQGPIEPLNSLEGLKIRLAPAFDVLSTVIYPLSTEVPLTMAGHRSYNRSAVLDLGRHLGINGDRVQRTLSQMGRDMVARVNEILESPPEMIAGRPDIMNAIDLIRCRVERACHEFGVDPYAEQTATAAVSGEPGVARPAMRRP